MPDSSKVISTYIHLSRFATVHISRFCTQHPKGQKLKRPMDMDTTLTLASFLFVRLSRACCSKKQVAI